MNIKTSLILTVFNEEKSIDAFLNSLLKQTLLPNEVIIVDGGSTDNTSGKIQRILSENTNLNFKVIVDPSCNKKHSKGPIAKGRNVAIRKCTHSHILVTDAGCILSPNWVLNMTSYFEQGYDVVAGVYHAQTENNVQKKLAKVFIPNFYKYKNFKEFLPSSRSFGFTKVLWEKSGGYPENSYTAEDTKFVKNIYALTDNVVIAIDATVEWEVPSTYAELSYKCEQYGFGDAIQGIDKLKYTFRLLTLLVLPISILVFYLINKPIIGLYMYFYQVKGYARGLFSL